LFGFIAGVAPQLGLMTGVVVLPQRQAVLVAKQAAEVDVMTGGRFRLGLGLGWNAVEYEGLGMNFKDRGRRFEEQIDLMRRLWTVESLSYGGTHHSVTSAGICPLPIQRPIPIWIGARSEVVVKRATRIADGYTPFQPLGASYRETMDKIHGWLQEAGRDPASFGIEGRLNASTGTPDDWRQTVEEWRRLGASHLSVDTFGAGLSGADAHIQRLRQVRDLVYA
jgi:probable F420-dependent oxidoreductase